MQIQLKQVEIITALKNYITLQGINLVDKTVDISFTAGRKDTGLSADITIEDTNAPLPNLAPDAETTKPVLALIQGSAVAAIATPETDTAIATPETDTALAEPVAMAAAMEAPAKSLFN